MDTKDEKAQIVALIAETGEPSDSYSTGFANALLLAQGIVNNSEEVFQYDVPADSGEGGQLSFLKAAEQLGEGKPIRRASWDDGKYLQIVKGRLYLFCPVRGREHHNGEFNMDDITADDWLESDNKEN